MKSGKFSTFGRHALKAALASAVVLGGAGFVINASAADGTGTADATVVTPIAIAASSPNLRFGSFSTSAAAQTVAIDTAGARTLTGALGVGTGQNAFGAASFAVTGDSTLTYAITLPTTSTISTDDAVGVTKNMTVSSFVSNPSGTGTLTAGAQTLLVGATVTTVASQVAGAYTGTFTVTVAYN
ncbi:MAG: DUF4402 domain-containing protein [Oxalobacteraceae bacterium]|nr:DUF4402 domain-containing protein [Oxalobacteraceae bacterium]